MIASLPNAENLQLQPQPRRLHAVVLAVLVFIFYALHAYSLGFVYDDREQILSDNSSLNSAELLEIFTRPHFSNNSYYRPLARLFLKLQLTLFGKSATALHLGNCLLAAGIALMLFTLFSAITKAPPSILFLAVLCTAMHPIFSACVYMISGQEALIATLLIITAVWLYQKQQTFMACLVAFAAMLSRENSLVIPFFLTTVFFITPEQSSPKPVKTEIWRLAAMWFTVILYLTLRHLALPDSISGNMLLQPGKTVMAFIYLLQSVIIPEPELVYEPVESVWVALPTFFALLLASIALYRNRKSLQKAEAKYWLAWICIMFLPTSNLLLQQTAYDERHNLIALPGFTGLLLVFTSHILHRHRKVLLLIILAMTLLLAGISHNRAQFFLNDFNFATQWLKTDPNAGEPYAIMGVLLQEKGQLEGAKKMFEQAIRCKPSMASAYDNLGALLGNADNPVQAALIFRQSVALEPDNPIYRYNLAMALLNSNRQIECLSQLHLARVYSTDNTTAAIDSGIFQAWLRILCWRYQLTNPMF